MLSWCAASVPKPTPYFTTYASFASSTSLRDVIFPSSTLSDFKASTIAAFSAVNVSSAATLAACASPSAVLIAVCF